MFQRFLLFLVIGWCTASFAEGNSYFVDSIKPKEKFINYGVSLGIGGSRLYYAVPNIAVKLPRTNLEFMGFRNNNRRDLAFQVTFDWIRLHPTRTDKESYVTLSYGFWNHYRFERFRGPRHMTMIGLNRYKHNSNWRRSIKLGWLAFRDSEWSTYGYWVSRGAPYDTPYAEFSMSWYFNRMRVKPISKEVYTELPDTTYTSGIGDYFNPYLTVGFGPSKALITPGIGIRSDNLNVELNMIVGPLIQFAAEAAVDVGTAERRENGYVRSSWGAFAFAISDWDAAVFGTGLSFGKSRYFFNRKKSRHVRVGLAYIPLDSRNTFIQGIGGVVIPVGSISYNIYAFRMTHRKASKQLQKIELPDYSSIE